MSKKKRIGKPKDFKVTTSNKKSKETKKKETVVKKDLVTTPPLKTNPNKKPVTSKPKTISLDDALSNVALAGQRIIPDYDWLP